MMEKCLKFELFEVNEHNTLPAPLVFADHVFRSNVMFFMPFTIPLELAGEMCL